MVGQSLEVVVASRNRGKVAELRRLFRAVSWQLVDLDDVSGGHEIQWIESGATYLENAEIKARAVSERTGMPSLADDSGIEIAALAGWPGIRTARWMGDEVAQDQLLMGLTKRIATLPADHRGARFVCALALVLPASGVNADLLATEAALEGSLLTEPRGAHGFGYDPIFVPNGASCTMAEMSQADKDEISHRGMAVRQLLAELR